MKPYERLEMEVIVFETEDVITTSNYTASIDTETEETRNDVGIVTGLP